MFLVLFEQEGRNSAVGTATFYELDDSGIESWWGRDYPHTFITAHTASFTMSTGSFPEVKRPERGVDHPPHLPPKLKKE